MVPAEEFGTNFDMLKELVAKCTQATEQNPRNVIKKFKGNGQGQMIEFGYLRGLQVNLSNYVRTCKAVAKKFGKCMSKIIKNIIDLKRQHINSQNI